MKERKSRFSREPVLNSEGKPVIIYPNRNDLKLFQLLHRYRYLPANFLLAFTGFNYTYLKRRLEELYSNPNCFLDRPLDQQKQPYPLSRSLIHELDKNGEQALKDAGLWDDEPCLGDEKLLTHSLMVSTAIASIQLGAQIEQKRDDAMIWWPEIAAKFKSKSSVDPKRSIPVNIAHQFDKHYETSSFDYCNDSNGAFGIRFLDDKVRFLSLEAENANTIDPTNLKVASFLKKLLAILDMMDRGSHKAAWGIPNLIHLFVTNSQSKIDTMKEIVMRETKGKGCTFIAFYKVPRMIDREPMKPMPEMFTAGWQRAGHADLHLNEPVERRK